MMGFVTPALLGGAALIALPIVLHLVMRREARHLDFPALQFVRQRRSMNQHRLRLRHLLLLALRCAIIGLLAFALARPTLRGLGTAAKDSGPVAAVLVIDNSLRMQYEQHNQTRLAKAQGLAKWLLEQLPSDSPVAVIDRSGRYRSQDLDRDAAELRVERTELSGAVRPMGEALRDACDWLREQKDFRGEIYVFTDMSTVAWSPDTLHELAGGLRDLPGTNVYLIDVGVAEPRGFGLGALRLSSQQLAPGGLLQLDTDLVATGQPAGGDVTVELYLGENGRAAEKRGEQVVTLPTPSGRRSAVTERRAGGEGRLPSPSGRGAGGEGPHPNPLPQGEGTEQPRPVEFSLAGLGLGTHQGRVRIVGDDPLPCDNTRYFTVDVRPPRKLLLVGERAADTLFLREALAPSSAAGLVRADFSCQTGTIEDLAKLPLADFDAICLVDPPPLAEHDWQALVDYVRGGGGLGVFLGRHARRDEFNQPAPQQLLPAMLRWQSRDATYLRPVAVEQPALADLRGLADIAPWSEYPVFSYWELEPASESAHVVASFANGKPAIVERLLGAGRVLMMTTPVSDPAHDDPWNLLPTGSDPWPFLALAHGMAKYLSGGADTQLNYLAGQTAMLRLSPDEQVTSFVLQMPDGEAVRQTLTPGQQDLSVASTDEPGNYRLRAGGRKGGLDRGFSVNYPAEMSRLERITLPQIADVVGKDRVRLARTRQEIEVRVGLGRFGRELFPALIVAVAVVLGAEQLLANRFYRKVP
jgi:hypothetical protein